MREISLEMHTRYFLKSRSAMNTVATKGSTMHANEQRFSRMCYWSLTAL